MFSVTFIKRPILATVISLLIIVGGIVSLRILPISEYPDVAQLPLPPQQQQQPQPPNFGGFFAVVSR